MGYEMKGHVVGLMPAGEFLQEFLPTSQIPNYDASSFTSAFAPGVFSSTLSAVNEQHAYEPFINTMKYFTPQLSFIDSHNHADMVNCSSFTFSVKPDVCIYADATSRGTDISTAEIIIEFKWDYCHDTFREVGDSIISPTDNSMDTLGQITSYAAAQLGAQYRSHAFSVLIMPNFFHRYAQASPELRGIDTSVSPPSAEEAALARSRLKLPDAKRIFKVSIPIVDGSGMLTLIIPQPVAYGVPPIGRGTCTCPAFDLLNDKVVMFKDSCHTEFAISQHVLHAMTYPALSLSKSPRPSGFQALHGPCPNCDMAITLHTLHRLALNIVGVTLIKFESSHQLVQSIHDALIAHKDTYELAKVLHRDLSVGNIVVHNGIGLLIDWDLEKLVTIQGPRTKERTRVADDLESSLYVLLWTALKYTETSMDIVDQTLLLMQVFDGGSSKEGWLLTRTNLPHDAFVSRKSLDNLVAELCVFFSHWYTKIPDDERAALANLQLVLQAQSAVKGQLYMAVQKFMEESLAYKHEMGMKVLHSHNAVINLYDKHLQVPGWPEDPAVEQKVLMCKSAGRMVTKSILSSQAEVTPTGKKRRLNDIVAEDDSGAPSLHGVLSEVGDGMLSVTGLNELKSLKSHFIP
ncbi:hypothetical protein DFH29DRAFT_1002369 [Suillus ampliporus]|nr:hypothetical protein DFH29DRAFT_1002369 [Suillus ampliporus]